MSTKAMKQLARLCMDEGYTPEIQKMGADALAEVEAIESACKRIAGGYIKVRAHDDEDDHHVMLLDNIGEEASK